MSDIASILSAAAGRAFADQGLDASLGQVRRADRPDLADFQCNGAMAAGKAAKRNPRELAAVVAPLIEAHEAVAEVTIAGPGFLNIRVTPDVLSERASEVLADPQAGGGYAVRTYIKPFANWIWAGTIIMAIGGLLSLSDRRYRVAAGAARAQVAPRGVPAE